MYIWLDTTQSPPVFKVTNSSGLPARINSGSLQADGTTVTLTAGSKSASNPNLIFTVTSSGNGYFTDNDSDGGYEHPYDCVDNSSGYTNTNAMWTPSSGADNLEGVLRFDNCVNTSGDINFSCPC